MRTIQSVLDELREEQHVPMLDLVEELQRRAWAGRLGWDLSMLRLWISSKDDGAIEAMVVYADGRGGGRASAPYLDAFATTLLDGSNPSEVSTESSADTIDTLQRWFSRGSSDPGHRP